MVIEADDPSNLPYSIFVLPEVNELRLADRLCIFVPRVVETVNTDFHRAIIGDGIYLQCPGNKLSGHFAANIVLDGLNYSLPGAAQAGDIVIELQIVRQERSEFLQIAMVVSVEKLGIQRLNGQKERVGRRRSLCVDVSQWCGNESRKNEQ